MMNYEKISFLFLGIIILSGLCGGQIRIKELPAYDLIRQDSLFLNQSRARNFISLDGRWYAYKPGKSEDKNPVSVPSNFQGGEELTFEKEFKLTQQQISQNRYQLVFLGLSHSAEIIFNNYVIYKHPGGAFPFRIDLPKDLLKSSKNILAVRIQHHLSAENSIPVSQRFLFPESIGGIFRDVYLQAMPQVLISSLDFSYRFENRRIVLSVNARVENHPIDEKANVDSSQRNEYSLRTRLVSAGGEDLIGAVTGFQLIPRRDKFLNQSYDISNAALWTPATPHVYKLRLQLLKGEEVIDEIIKPISIYSLTSDKENLQLNGAPFTMIGTTYFPSYGYFGNLASYERMREDIKLIKATGFNTVRFEKALPHPFLLKLCEEYGLLAMVDLPLNSIPGQITESGSFADRSRSYLAQMIAAYKEYSAVAAIGLGGSYVCNSEAHNAFISSLAEYSHKLINKLTYASYIGFDILPSDKLDLYGVEMMNRPVEDFAKRYLDLETALGKGKVFVSEATYATFMGSTNGYSNPFSHEAQAKFFSDFIDFARNEKISGYIINSMFDYRGDYCSFSAGYNGENLYSIGLLGEDRQLNRLSQKVVSAKLHDEEAVTIPIGTKRDDSPAIFILFGVALAIIIGVLVNSKRKFREDATRALLRPYNFYADIRDQRILSGFHSNFLMLVLSLCSALLQVNLLYFFRSNVLLEKIVLSFGAPGISKFISYLAWNPFHALIWTTILSMLFFIAATCVIKIASFFIRNKVFLSSIYFMVIWSFLPLILLLPLGLILYKVLNADVITMYLLVALSVFTIWIFYRLMKGIYVIFDINPARVYFYSLAFLLALLGGILLYFHLSESSIYYLVNAFKQYKVM